MYENIAKAPYVPPPKPQGLGEVFDTNLKRLSDVLSRIYTIGETIHGPVPSAVADGNATAGRMTTSHASRLGDLSALVSQIEAAVGRIGDGL